MLRTLRRRAITTGLDLARLPADLFTRVLPNGASGPRLRAQVFVDQLDAAARTILGGLLGDEELQADGTRRRVAALQRVKATADAKIARAQAA